MAPDEPLPLDKFGNPIPKDKLGNSYKPGRLSRGKFSGAATLAMAMAATTAIPPYHRHHRRGDVIDYVTHTSRETLNHPSGSTRPGLRANRKAKRICRMRLRKLRGWH